MRALVATVVPCTMRSVRASRRPTSSASVTARRRSPSSTPSVGSRGVEGALASVTWPASSTATRSVKVPPTSMPMRNIRADPTEPSPRAGLSAAPPGHEPVVLVSGPGFRRLLSGLAPTAAAARLDEEHIAGLAPHPDFFRLQLARMTVGEQAVAVRAPVLAASHAARPVPDAVARGVGARELPGLDDELQHRADAAAVAPLAPGVGQELVAAEEEREADLGDLQAAELDAARGLPLAGRRPAIPGRGGATAGPSLEHVPDEGAAGAGMGALQRDAEAPPPAGHRALRTGAGQRLDDGLGDLLGAVIGAERDGGGRPRPGHRALARDHPQRAEGAVVLGNVGIDEVGQGHGDGRAHVGV